MSSEDVRELKSIEIPVGLIIGWYNLILAAGHAAILMCSILVCVGPENNLIAKTVELFADVHDEITMCINDRSFAKYRKLSRVGGTRNNSSRPHFLPVILTLIALWMSYHIFIALIAWMFLNAINTVSKIFNDNQTRSQPHDSLPVFLDKPQDDDSDARIFGVSINSMFVVAPSNHPYCCQCYQNYLFHSNSLFYL